jgi:hypothetical protein
VRFACQTIFLTLSTHDSRPAHIGFLFGHILYWTSAVSISDTGDCSWETTTAGGQHCGKLCHHNRRMQCNVHRVAIVRWV